MKRICLIFCLLACVTCGCGRASRSKTGSQASLADLNRALALYDMTHGRYPRNVWELTNISTLRGKTLPVPPAGQKLAIDPASHLVVLTNDSKTN